MLTAIDDFGAGHSGLNMLADFQPDVVKIDMALIRNIDQDRVRRSIAKAIVQLCNDLNMSVIAEGVETLPEALVMRGLGVRLFQGYLFAKPALEQLPQVPEQVFDAVCAGHESLLLEASDPALKNTG
jgi:EAL domain-containing protein (putative c-di-GMP-specific phosphodiesterase class I)